MLSLVFTGVIKPLVSEEILSEYHDILNLLALDLDPEKVADVLTSEMLVLLRSIGEI